jgi:hypothetical protein
MEVALLESRPNVQPDAIDGLRRSMYAITDHIFGYDHSIPPNRIHKFDGGEGERNGQISWDIPDLSVRLTSEVDLLYETDVESVWVNMDWKTGHKIWTAAEVKGSFQFQMHAWLVFKRYEKPQTLITRIWNTRKNVVSRDVAFEREDLPQYEYRLRSAVEVWRAYRDTAPEQCPTWPSIEKCTICDAAHLCPVSGYSLETPEETLGRVVAVRAQLAAWEKRLTAVADKRGVPIEWKDARWGRDAPKETKKPTAKLWRVKT